MARQLKDVPKEEQEKMIALISKNPELFKNIAESAQRKIAAGKSQMEAIAEAAGEHEAELQRALGTTVG